MGYCTQDDVLDQLSEAQLIQCTDDNDTGSVDAAKVAQAIADADGEIDGYVGARYAVPLSPVPAIILKLAVDIAIYNLFSRRDEVPENRAERYKNAIRFLEQVAKGGISLGADDPEGSPPATEAPRMSSQNPARIFTRRKMSGF